VKTILAAFLFLAVSTAQQRSGNYEVSLRLPSSGLISREEMEIELRVVDLTRTDPLTGAAPVIRAAVDVRIDMPEMPGMAEYHEVAHPEGPPGEYGVHPTFAHGGDYRMRISVQPPQEKPFEVTFPLKVDDANSAPNRKPVPSRYSMEVTTTPKHPKSGESVEVRFIFRDRTNPKAIFSSFETVHEALFHLIVVRSDLAHFAHLHPTAEPDGSFRLHFTFPKGGDYRLFADVAPTGAGSQILFARVSANGDKGEIFDARTKSRRTQQIGGVTVWLLSPQDTFPVKRTIPVTVAIADAKTGEPIRNLEPYLGAAGHFLLVHQDGVTFVHSHPLADAASIHDGRVEFAARLPKAGLYRGWVQVKPNGELVTADFVVRADE